MKPIDKIIDSFCENVKRTNHLPWQSGMYGKPVHNPVTGTVYSGINVLLLWATGSSDPRYMTFKQAKKAGYKVKKGAKATPIVFYKSLEVGEDEDKKRIPMLRYYNVFNGSDIDGLPELETDKQVSLQSNTKEPVAVLKNYVQNEVIKIVQHGRPHYSSLNDCIGLPKPSIYKDQSEWILTFAHEAIHSTGHARRLDRGISIANSRGEYSREELVAEIGAATLCQSHGLIFDVDNSASYVSSWLRFIKNDPNALFKASKKAEKAVSYIESKGGTK